MPEGRALEDWWGIYAIFLGGIWVVAIWEFFFFFFFFGGGVYKLGEGSGFACFEAYTLLGSGFVFLRFGGGGGASI